MNSHRQAQAHLPVLLQGDSSIFLKNMQLQAIVGTDAWGRPEKAQPVILSIRAFRPVQAGDDIDDTLNYSKMSKDVMDVVTATDAGGGFPSVTELASAIWRLRDEWKVDGMTVEIQLPKAVLRADKGLTSTVAYTRGEPGPIVNEVRIEGLKTSCIIGVNPHERLEKQRVEVNVSFEYDGDARLARSHASAQWRTFTKRIVGIVEESSFKTVESLVIHIFDELKLPGSWPMEKLTLSVEKPSALPFVEGAGVQMTRNI